MGLCEPAAHDGSSENSPAYCHPELVSGSPDPATFEILKQVQDDTIEIFMPLCEPPGSWLFISYLTPGHLVSALFRFHYVLKI